MSRLLARGDAVSYRLQRSGTGRKGGRKPHKFLAGTCLESVSVLIRVTRGLKMSPCQSEVVQRRGGAGTFMEREDYAATGGAWR